MLLNLLFPRRCVSCNKFGKYFCATCRLKIKYQHFQLCSFCRLPSVNGTTHFRCLQKYSLDGVFIGSKYSGPVKKAIHQLKYRFVSDLVSELVEIVFLKYPLFLNNFDFVIPVPLHKKRFRERGFNQAFLIAQNIGRKLNIPVLENILTRSQYTKPQFGLSRDERKINVKNVFLVQDPSKIKNKNLCLIDDVATTFSTLNESAKVLKRNGAQKVWGIVLAHGN